VFLLHRGHLHDPEKERASGSLFVPKGAPVRKEASLHSSSVKVLALDYGTARTGVAISDETGTLARPLAVVDRASSSGGLRRILQLSRDERVDRIVVGMPITLRGEHGAQARETAAFVATLRAKTDLPVETFDERFTTKLARSGDASADEDAVAAAHLLDGYLTWSSDRHR
jgi:putative holliday junction resolvase